MKTANEISDVENLLLGVVTWIEGAQGLDVLAITIENCGEVAASFILGQKHLFEVLLVIVFFGDPNLGNHVNIRICNLFPG